MHPGWRIHEVICAIAAELIDVTLLERKKLACGEVITIDAARISVSIFAQEGTAKEDFAAATAAIAVTVAELNEFGRRAGSECGFVEAPNFADGLGETKVDRAVVHARQGGILAEPSGGLQAGCAMMPPLETRV
ncbi:MAG: hypothetical protein V3U86_04860 [Acidobacteriota bacterium]